MSLISSARRLLCSHNETSRRTHHQQYQHGNHNCKTRFPGPTPVATLTPTLNSLAVTPDQSFSSFAILKPSTNTNHMVSTIAGNAWSGMQPPQPTSWAIAINNGHKKCLDAYESQLYQGHIEVMNIYHNTIVLQTEISFHSQTML